MDDEMDEVSWMDAKLSVLIILVVIVIGILSANLFFAIRCTDELKTLNKAVIDMRGGDR